MTVQYSTVLYRSACLLQLWQIEAPCLPSQPSLAQNTVYRNFFKGSSNIERAGGLLHIVTSLCCFLFDKLAGDRSF